MLPNKRYNFFFLNHLPILCKDTNYIKKYLWKVLKNSTLRYFYAKNLFASILRSIFAAKN